MMKKDIGKGSRRVRQEVSQESGFLFVELIFDPAPLALLVPCLCVRTIN